MMVEMDIKGLPFAKGHGTGNDFVIVPDPAGELIIDAATVAALCDRRRGIGGDGLLRVVRTDGEWFMDYRNADGSIAEICANGVRVYARYLVESGLEPGPQILIRTRAGLVEAELMGETIAVRLPGPTVYGLSRARLHDVEYAGTVVDVGNPHLVCWVTDPSTLDLSDTPGLDPDAFPDGGNVEFIAPVADGHIRMRVIERGVGETQSCGSGAVAAAAVALDGTQGTVTVDVPGGRLTVTLDGDTCVLAGPAVIVAEGTTSL